MGASDPAVTYYHVHSYRNINNICVLVVYNGTRRPDAPLCAEIRTAQSVPEVRGVPERLLREQLKISQQPPSGNTSSSRRSGPEEQRVLEQHQQESGPPGWDLLGEGGGPGRSSRQRGTVYQAGDGSVQEGAERTPDAEKGLQGGEGMKRGRTSGWRCQRRT